MGGFINTEKKEKAWAHQLEVMEKHLPTKGYYFYNEELAKEVEAKLEKNPDDYDLNFKRGILYHDKDPLIGIECFSKCLIKEPFDHVSYFNRARKYLTRGQWNEALSDLTIACRLYDGETWYWHYMGVALYFLEKYNEAADVWKKSIEVSKAHEGDLQNCEVDWMWMALVKAKRYAEARKLLEDFDVNTPVIPVIGWDDGYKKRVLLLKGVTPAEEYRENINPAVVNEGGAVNDWHALARYYYYIAKDQKKALECLDQVEKPREGNYTWSWGYRYAQKDRPEWTAKPVSDY